MSLKSIELKNIKSMTKYKIVFQKENFAGWHVIIGENEAGSPSLARMIALCIIACLSRREEVFA